MELLPNLFSERVLILIFCVDYVLSKNTGSQDTNVPNVHNSLFAQCLTEEGLPTNTNPSNLDAFKWGRILACMDAKHDMFKRIALRPAVATFECMKFELYELLWNTGGPTGADFDIAYIPDYLPENLRADYRSHHKTWKTILDSSIHQGAIRFKNYLTKKIGVEKNGKKELNTELVSRDIAFAIVMLQNSKHGQGAKELSMDYFKTAQDVVVAIALTKCIEDPDIITMVEMFELVTRGKEED